MKNYYDPEYDREISEDKIRKQYEWFVKNQRITKTYEQFLLENFEELSETNEPYIMFGR